MSTEKMLDALMNGNNLEFKNEFHNAMNNIISTRLSEKKAEMADALANGVVVEEDEQLDEYIKSDGTRRRCAGGDGRRKGVKVAEEDDVEVDEGNAEEYEKFFRAALKKFGVESPADFKSEEEKKKFFDYVDKEYKADKEED